jgi:hypothetical protein
VIACLLKNEPASYFVSQVKGVKARSRSESESEEGVRAARSVWREVDPKPRELPMARVKVR